MPRYLRCDVTWRNSRQSISIVNLLTRTGRLLQNVEVEHHQAALLIFTSLHLFLWKLSSFSGSVPSQEHDGTVVARQGNGIDLPSAASVSP
ncbi:hypothetical protein P389DRAFT_171660 [Cystobasidium minutum MCA 4210]|uniref:uncharacterized protein n=1 Tax=Cystobasidium minutum MCA 4210 TaxID=1397322 RepID=UPI0034CF6746|eukprot:jgi/Rhomi1/171660/fgenesh1_kg.4_\